MGEILHIGSVNERTLQRLAGYVCTSYLTACQTFNPVSLLFVPKVGKSERWRVSEKGGHEARDFGRARPGSRLPHFLFTRSQTSHPPVINKAVVTVCQSCIQAA